MLNETKGTSLTCSGLLNVHLDKAHFINRKKRENKRKNNSSTLLSDSYKILNIFKKSDLYFNPFKKG